MRLTNKAIEELIEKLIGKDVLPLVKKLKDKKNISEFTLANRLRTTINHTRNMLYRLQSHNLVSYIRKKDKKKGWYIYFWTFNKNRAKELLISLKKKKLQELKNTLKNEIQTPYFTCQDKCLRLTFETAIDHNFKCPECGELLEQEDNTEHIKTIKKQIKALEKELKNI